MLGVMLAQRTHAPNCCIIFEAGTVGSQLAHLPMSVGDPRAMREAASAAGLFEVFTYVLQAGRVDVGFLSGAQVDRFGNINSTSIGARPAPSRGALLRQRRRRATSPAWRGARSSSPCTRSAASPRRWTTSPARAGWRAATAARRAGLVRGGPSVVVTTKGVMRFRPETKADLPGQLPPGPDARRTWPRTPAFRWTSQGATETPTPTPEELRILREVVDPERVFLN